MLHVLFLEYIVSVVPKSVVPKYVAFVFEYVAFVVEYVAFVVLEYFTIILLECVVSVV